MKHSPLDFLKRNILELLRANPHTPYRRNEIARYLRIPSSSPEYEFLRNALDELERGGEIEQTGRRRYVFAAVPATIAGTLRVQKSGAAIVETEEGDVEQIVIGRQDTFTALHGDKVRARIFPVRPGKPPAGEVIEILERRTMNIVGTLEQRGNFFVVEPDDPRLTHDIYVARRLLMNAKPSEKVVVKLYPWEDPLSNPEGQIVEVIGEAGDPRVEINSIARGYNLSHEFPPAVAAESEAIPGVIPEEELAARADFRGDMCFTIDPEDARDFDDAVSMKKLSDGSVELGVHIADVSHYVKDGSALDAEALRRGTSTYLVNGVVPMLPDRLSSDVCSLLPEEDRLTYSIVMQVSPRGVVRSYRICKSVIHSRRRFTYDEALERIESGRGDYAEELRAMQRFADILTNKRHREGGIDFETPEVKFRFDANGMPVEVLPKSRNNATKLIEEFMLLANQTAARHAGELARAARRNALPFIYRVHDTPNPDKLRDLALFVKQFGYTLHVEDIKPQAIQKLLEGVHGAAEETLINEITLRSMAKAIYSEFNIGHFGLSFRQYTHFTSPIRRYPDLMVHRMLFAYERGINSERILQFGERVGDIAEWCSQREREAVEAERESVKVAQAEYISQHLGGEFDGLISGVQHYGIFIELKENFAEGLVRARDMEDDYYLYDEEKFALIGKRTKKTYRLGDPVRVRVIRVNKKRHEVDFQIIGAAAPADSRTQSREGAQRKKKYRGKSKHR